jgi:putative ABC transport system permease protein
VVRLDPLHRKLLRDMLGLWSQVLAISLIVACGIASYVSMQSVYQSMKATQAAYYADCDFADLFASLRRAPAHAAARVAAIPGVAVVEPRVVLRAMLDVPGLRDPASGIIVSVPEGRQPKLNRLFLRGGRLVGSDPSEIDVGDAFARANHLTVGDRIGAIINGRWQRLRIVGIALSPEYVYTIAFGSLFPDNRRFGTIWMGQEALASVLAMKGAFNDLAISTLPGANQRAILAAVDRVTAAYGGVGAYTRENQLSNRFVSDEILQLRSEAVITPAIFLGLAVFMLGILLSRLIQNERSQIAVLKALGYPYLRIALHYLEFAMVIVLAGSAAGAAGGMWLGQTLVHYYVNYFDFPVFRYVLNPDVIATAMLVSAIAAAAGALRSVRDVLVLPPAEAMRAPAPAEYRPTVVERLGLQRFFAPGTRMMLRNIERKPMTALFTAAGVACAMAVLVVGRFTFDSIDRLVSLEFDRVERADATVMFNDVRTARARFDLSHLPGVIRAEAFRVVPVRLRAGSRSYQTYIWSYDRDDRLHHLVGSDMRTVPLSDRGITLVTKLAEILHVRAGDSVQVEVLDGDRRVRDVRVAQLVDEPFGTGSYMDAPALSSLLDQDRPVTGAWLALDANERGAFDAAVKQMPAVSFSFFRSTAVTQIRETIAKSLNIAGTAIVAIATLIAFAVLYNAARMALSERARELSTLRIVGLTRAEIAMLLLGEYVFLTVLAMPLGAAAGYGLSVLLAASFDTELYRLPVTVSPFTYGFATLVILGSVAATAAIVVREVARLDLVAVLKARE